MNCTISMQYTNEGALITEITVSVKTDRLEAASEVKLALHHVKEDGNGGFTQLDLRNAASSPAWDPPSRDET